MIKKYNVRYLIMINNTAHLFARQCIKAIHLEAATYTARRKAHILANKTKSKIYVIITDTVNNICFIRAKMLIKPEIGEKDTLPKLSNN